MSELREMWNAVSDFWTEVQKDRPENFDNVGWFLLCGGLLFAISLAAPRLRGER